MHASPKAISRRTSYLWVRLEFLRYPQVISTFFNRCEFGPPLPFTVTSSCPWVGHPVSGLLSVTKLALFRLGFPSASYLLVLNLATPSNSPDRSTKSTRLHSYGASTACKHRVSGSFSLPSRGSFHLSFTVLCAIGHRGVFRLGGWSLRLPTRFLVSRGTLDTARLWSDFVYGIFTLFDTTFQTLRLSFLLPRRSPQPQSASTLVWPVSLSLAAT